MPLFLAGESGHRMPKEVLLLWAFKA